MGKDAYCFSAFADALEVIPYTLSENAGMKSMDVVIEVRAKHAGVMGAGINIEKGIVADAYELNVVQSLSWFPRRPPNWRRKPYP
jgi:T-complex protein 1 subunit delta